MREYTKTLFLSDGTCLCISTVMAIATFDWRRTIRSESWPKAKRRPHRWAPEKGYVTFKVRDEKDLAPAMELIQMSHDHFAGERHK
jgi:Family of unknown function (DUF5519)